MRRGGNSRWERAEEQREWGTAFLGTANAVPRPSQLSVPFQLLFGQGRKGRSLDFALRAPLGMTEGPRCALRSG